MKRLHRQMLGALVLLGIGGGALAYTFVTKIENEGDRHRRRIDEARLFHFGRIDVVSGTIETRGATIAFARDEEFGWVLTSPVSWPADQEAIESAVIRMVGMRADEEVSDNATEEELRNLSLVAPLVSMYVTLKSGEKKALHIGQKNTLRNLYPVTDGAKKRVGLANPEFYWAFDRPTFDFREKRVVPHAPGSIVSFAFFKQQKESYRVIRDKQELSIVSGGMTAPADPGRVGLVLTAITKHLKAKDFLQDDFVVDEHGAKYGLDNPAAAIEVTLDKGKKWQVNIGHPKASGSTTVMHVVGTNTVIEVAQTELGKIDRPGGELRDQALSRYKRDRVRKIDLHLGAGAPITVQRTGDDWNVVKPEQHRAKGWQIDTIVTTYSLLKAERVETNAPTAKQLADWFLDPPSRRIIIYGEGDVVLSDLSIGNKAKDGIYAKPTNGTRVGVIEVGKVKILPTTLQEIVEDE